MSSLHHIFTQLPVSTIDKLIMDPYNDQLSVGLTISSTGGAVLNWHCRGQDLSPGLGLSIDPAYRK